MTAVDSGAKEAGLALEVNDSLAVAGSRWLSTSATDVAVARYLANGASDPTFGTPGLTPQWPQSRATGVVVDQDGGYVLAVKAEKGDYSSSDFAALRLTSFGQLDGAYGAGGLSLVNVDVRGQALSMAIDPTSGSAVVAGSTRGSNIATSRAIAIRLVR